MINGSNLAAERETRGVTLEEVQCSTKLGLHFLTAIEAEDFAQLPGGIYDISFIRQYCRAIGCDEAPLLKRYSDSRRVAEPSSSVRRSCADTIRPESSYAVRIRTLSGASCRPDGCIGVNALISSSVVSCFRPSTPCQ
jgi:hypothetical protein